MSQSQGFSGLYIGAWASGFGVWGLGFRISGLGFRVWCIRVPFGVLLRLVPYYFGDLKQGP